ncbi:MAG TPA: UPF0149 family protein [Fibrobacteraceae bacterium]|nr:UPF0149 family protein [Fibrobacteraceae bacterium]
MDSVLASHLKVQYGPYGPLYASGFLSGLQCNPDPVEPTEWMNQVLWKTGHGEFPTESEARSIAQALSKEMAETDRRLQSGHAGVSALMDGTDFSARLSQVYLWVMGFFDAVYLEGNDIIGVGEGDQSAIAAFEVLLSAAVQRGLAGRGNAAYEALQTDGLPHLLRDDLIDEMLPHLDRNLVRAYRHFRGIDPICLEDV